MTPQLEARFAILVVGDADAYVGFYDDPESLNVRMEWEGAGTAIISVPYGHDLLNYVTYDRRIMVIISHPSFSLGVSSWRLEFRGLIRDSQIVTDDFGNLNYLIIIRELTGIVERYVSAYPTEINDRSSWVGQEIGTIVDNILEYNMTAAATTANGRVRDATVLFSMGTGAAIPGLPAIDYTLEPGRNLLEATNELGRYGGFVVRVVADGVQSLTNIGNDLIVAPRVGDDYSDEVFFAFELDNVSDVVIDSDSLRERTIAIVGGKGAGTDRTFVIRQGDNYDTNNDKEMWVDGSTTPDSELSDLGDLALQEAKARVVMNARIQPTFGWNYPEDYQLGSLVTLILRNGSLAVKRIVSIEWNFDQGLDPTFTVQLDEP